MYFRSEVATSQVNKLKHLKNKADASDFNTVPIVINQPEMFNVKCKAETTGNIT